MPENKFHLLIHDLFQKLLFCLNYSQETALLLIAS
jgi:hypothetical protein